MNSKQVTVFRPLVHGCALELIGQNQEAEGSGAGRQTQRLRHSRIHPTLPGSPLISESFRQVPDPRSSLGNTCRHTPVQKEVSAPEPLCIRVALQHQTGALHPRAHPGPSQNMRFSWLSGRPREHRQGLGDTPWVGERAGCIVVTPVCLQNLEAPEFLGLILSIVRTHDLNQSVQIQINSDPAHPPQEPLWDS